MTKQWRLIRQMFTTKRKKNVPLNRYEFCYNFRFLLWLQSTVLILFALNFPVRIAEFANNKPLLTWETTESAVETERLLSSDEQYIYDKNVIFLCSWSNRFSADDEMETQKSKTFSDT